MDDPLNDIQNQAKNIAETPNLLKNVDDVINKWLVINDFGVCKALPAFIIANFLPGNPVWVFLVGGSGAGKTELLNSLLDLTDIIYPLSSLTPNTFISGMKGYPGLIYELDGKVLSFKDFTTILDMNIEARAAIMSQLREIYDGEMVKKFGTGENGTPWKGKVGVIAAVTSIIDFREQAYTALGERFIKYRINPPGRKSVGKRALRNTTQIAEMQQEIKDAMSALVKGVMTEIIHGVNLKLSEDEENALIDLADMATLARSPIVRDFGPAKEIIFKPTSEMPTRFVQQLAQIGLALRLINKVVYKKDELLPDDHKILYKISLDSIPSMRRQVLQQIAIVGTATTAQIAMELNLPTNTTGRNLEDLNLLGLLERDKQGNENAWTIKPEFRDIFIKYDDVKLEVDDDERLAAIAEEERILREEKPFPTQAEIEARYDDPNEGLGL